MRKFDVDEIDKECVDLCNAINTLPGCRTTCSCSGHGKSPYEILFKCNNSKSLYIITLAANIINNPLYKNNEWTCKVWASAEATLTPVIGGFSGFRPHIEYSLISTSVGKNIYSQSQEIAVTIQRLSKSNNQALYDYYCSNS